MRYGQGRGASQEVAARGLTDLMEERRNGFAFRGRSAIVRFRLFHAAMLRQGARKRDPFFARKPLVRSP